MQNLHHGFSWLAFSGTSTRLAHPGVLAVLACLLALLGGPVSAADEKTDSALTEQLQASFAAVEGRRDQITELERRLPGSEGDRKKILVARLAHAWGALMGDGLTFVEEVTQHMSAGEDVGPFKDVALEVLAGQNAVAHQALELLQKHAELPAEDLPAADMAAAYARWFKIIGTVDEVFAAEIRALELSGELGLDVSAESETIQAVLINRAANNSILLEAATNSVTGLKAGVDVLPGDVELAAKLQVAKNRVRGMAAALESAIGLMEQMELDASPYRAQVLQATGDVTTDILNPSVIFGLLSSWWSGVLDGLAENAPALLFNLLLFFLVIFIARRLAKIVQRLVEHSLKKSQLRLSQLLERMIVSIARNTVMVLGVLIALSQIGISLGPVLAGLGVAGFVIGFALQDTLSNFASGMMILIYRPFDVGDFVEAGTVLGTVHHMSLVNTTIMTVDNQTIVVPNNKIWGDVIRNVTHQDKRRIDLTFGISYTDDIPKTERVLQEIVDEQALILKDPEAIIRLHELGDSSVNFCVRPWVLTEDYWDVYWYMMRTVKMRFDEEGISIPFPQRDVHLYAQQTTPAVADLPPETGEPRPVVVGRAQITDTDDGGTDS